MLFVDWQKLQHSHNKSDTAIGKQLRMLLAVDIGNPEAKTVADAGAPFFLSKTIRTGFLIRLGFLVGSGL